MNRNPILARALRSALVTDTSRRASILAAWALSLSVGDAALAQSIGTAAQQPQERITVTGSRVSNRVVSDSATPIDLLTAEEISSTGQIQLHSALKIVVPSFSVSAPATAGALDFTSSPRSARWRRAPCVSTIKSVTCLTKR